MEFYLLLQGWIIFLIKILGPVMDIEKLADIGQTKDRLSNSRNVFSGTRPSIIACLLHDSGFNGISLGVADAIEKIGVIHGERMIATFPHIPRPAFPGIDDVGIPSIHFSKALSKARFRRRDRVEMQMVIHKAVSEIRNAEPLSVLVQQFEYEQLIGFEKENVVLTIPPIENMIGDAGDNDSCYSRHYLSLMDSFNGLEDSDGAHPRFSQTTKNFSNKNNAKYCKEWELNPVSD